MRSFIKRNKRTSVFIIIIVIIAGFIMINRTENKSNIEHSHEHHDEEHTVWTCSMHPQIEMDEAGQCPICGMDLIPKDNLKIQAADNNSIVFSEAAAALANIQTAKVRKIKAMKEIELQGKIMPDERKIAKITARYGGRIEKLFINYTGQQVRKGEVLATIYSPELITAQKELIIASQFKTDRPSFYRSAIAKLKHWGLSDQQIQAIEDKGTVNTNFYILSPIEGTVSQRNIALGQYIQEGLPLFEITNLENVWGVFNAYEDDISLVKTDDKVYFTVDALQGKEFSSKVSYIDPFIDPETRTATIRIDIKNAKGLLKPEMFVKGEITSPIDSYDSSLVVPKSAVLWTGKQSVVYVQSASDEEGKAFKYREVVLGPETNNAYIIEKGLDEGELIAVNGVFKLDAAAQLMGKKSMMNKDGSNGNAGHSAHQHGAISGSNAETSNNDGEHSAHQHSAVTENHKDGDCDNRSDSNNEMIEKYFVMKNAFVSSKVDAIRESAEAILKQIQQSTNVDAASANKSDLEKSLKEIITGENLSDQRKSFAEFNAHLSEYFEESSLPSIEMYYQYCPMAENNEGAYWFSEKQEIFNPYFGDAMLHCGENILKYQSVE